MARGKATGRYSPGRDRGSSSDDSSSWLTTYGDAITLLLAFFVLLYAMSDVKIDKFRAFVEGLKAPFGNEASVGLLPDNSSLVDQGESDIPSPVTVSPPPLVPPDPVSPDAGDRAQLDEVQEAIDASLVAAGFEGVADYRYDERGLVVSIAADDVLFATGSTEIGRVGRGIVAAVAQALRRFPNDVLVEGHTDDVPLRRGGYTNWNLSTDRAVAVLSLLIEEFGLPPARLGAVGYGEQRPRVANSGAKSRALNRRVDVLVGWDGGTDG